MTPTKVPTAEQARLFHMAQWGTPDCQGGCCLHDALEKLAEARLQAQTNADTARSVQEAARERERELQSEIARLRRRLPSSVTGVPDLFSDTE